MDGYTNKLGYIMYLLQYDISYTIIINKHKTIIIYTVASGLVVWVR